MSGYELENDDHSGTSGSASSGSNTGTSVNTSFDDYYEKDGSHHIDGKSGDDSLNGGKGDDYFKGGAGDDHFYGNGGTDVSQYSGSSSQYDVVERNGNIEIHDKVASRDGNDTLTGVAEAKFSDGMLVFDHTSTSDASAYRLYQAAFGRTPDTNGFRFWADQIDTKGKSLPQVAHEFLSSAEFQKAYGSNQTDDQFVTALYKNVLGRTPDADGITFWKKAIAGGLSHEQALMNFADSPEDIQLTASHMSHGFWTT